MSLIYFQASVPISAFFNKIGCRLLSSFPAFTMYCGMFPCSAKCGALPQRRVSGLGREGHACV